MKTLVWGAVGAFDDLFNTFALEWAISLRYLANYKEDVLLLDYGLEESTRKILNTLDIKLIKKPSRGHSMVSNTRFVDILPIVLHDYYDYNIFLFDIDIWFQDNLDDLIFLIEKEFEDGVLFSAERIIKPVLENKGPQDRIEKIKIRSKYQEIQKKYKGIINSGFFAGQYKPVLSKLIDIREYFANLYEMPKWGSDQLFVNLCFDFNKDKANGYKWNCVIPDCYIRNGIFYTDKSGNEEKVVGVHCYGNEGSDPTKMLNYKSIRENRFHFLYQDLFRRICG